MQNKIIVKPVNISKVTGISPEKISKLTAGEKIKLLQLYYTNKAIVSILLLYF